ncbi:MAG: hypothetical protein LYZ69_05200 [Nitrososphaerales archaeon]|nr:hypothetical protein [Nitrososphaerales archaeon]
MVVPQSGSKRGRERSVKGCEGVPVNSMTPIPMGSNEIGLLRVAHHLVILEDADYLRKVAPLPDLVIEGHPIA